MSRRGLTIAGLAIAGGAGYYLYVAGGDPKAAEKRFEADISKASAKVSGREKEAQKKGEEWAQRTGAKVDQAAADAKSKLAEAEAKAKEYKDSTGKELHSAVDQFDKTVEEKVTKAKTGISSWFGGK